MESLWSKFLKATDHKNRNMKFTQIWARREARADDYDNMDKDDDEVLITHSWWLACALNSKPKTENWEL